MKITRAERIEMTAIAVAAIASLLAWRYLPPSSTFGGVVLGLSALLLMQSLVRDIAILLRHRAPARIVPRRETQSVCMESTIGITGIVGGIMLTVWSGSEPVPLGPVLLSTATTGTLALGFLIKDLAISWNPWAVRREPDHVNLIVRWKKR